MAVASKAKRGTASKPTPKLGKMPQTAETMRMQPIPAHLRGVQPGALSASLQGLPDIDTTGLRGIIGPSEIASTRKPYGFIPIQGRPAIVGTTGNPALVHNPADPVGSYMVKGARASTSVPLTATGERWSGSSPTWAMVDGQPQNIDRALAGMGEPVSLSTTQALVANPPPPPPSALQAPAVSQPASLKQDEARQRLASYMELAAKTGQLSNLQGQLPLVAQQLGLTNLRPEDRMGPAQREAYLSLSEVSPLAAQMNQLGNYFGFTRRRYA